MQYSTAKKMNETLLPVTTWMNLTGTCQRKEARHKKLPTVWFNLQKVYKQAKLSPGLEDRMAIPLGRRQGTVVGQACRGGSGVLAKLFLHLEAGYPGVLTCANSLRSTQICAFSYMLCFYLKHFF